MSCTLIRTVFVTVTSTSIANLQTKMPNELVGGVCMYVYNPSVPAYMYCTHSVILYSMFVPCYHRHLTLIYKFCCSNLRFFVPAPPGYWH